MRLLTGGLFALSLAITPALVSAQAASVSVGPEQNQSFITVADMSGGGYPGGGAPTGQNLAMYQAGAGSIYDGVARLLMSHGGGGVSGCTGTRIASAFILTAAHCVSSGGGPSIAANAVTATFLEDLGGGLTGLVNYQSTAIHVRAGYTGAVVSDRDLALIEFAAPLAAWIPSYSLFNGNPLFQEIKQVGFGRTGNGLTGGILTQQFDDIIPGGNDTPIRRVASNSWEATRNATTLYYNTAPVTDILVSDFDGQHGSYSYPVTPTGVFAGTTLAQNDRLCNIFGAPPGHPLCHQGYGALEGSIGSGDSGGPAFIDVGGQLQVAGVASFGNVRCVPSQTGATSSGCPAGYITNGAYFSAMNGHVAVSYGDNYTWIQDTTATPEPVTMVLLGTGLAAVAAARRRRKADQTQA